VAGQVVSVCNYGLGRIGRQAARAATKDPQPELKIVDAGHGLHKRKFGLDLDKDGSLCEGRLEDPKGQEDPKGLHKHKFGWDLDEDERLCEDRPDMLE
ncbi:unnamed protein product, partial [Prorocentrum cordatum]